MRMLTLKKWRASNQKWYATNCSQWSVDIAVSLNYSRLAVVSFRNRSSSTMLSKGRRVARDGRIKPRATSLSSVAGEELMMRAASHLVTASLGNGWIFAADSR
jgi:hypothetical protein